MFLAREFLRLNGVGEIASFRALTVAAQRGISTHFLLANVASIHNHSICCTISIAREQLGIYNDVMSTPELTPEQPTQQPEVVQPRVEQPIVPETQQQLGVSAPPQAPQAVVNDNNQVIATPVPTQVVVEDTTPAVVVPVELAADEKELEKGAHGPSNLAVTWLDMYWLREVGKAFSKGWRVIFGKK